MAFRPVSLVLAVPALGLLLSLGCGESEQVRALDIAELPERFACDDVTVVAATPDGAEALLIGVEDGLAAAALESSEVVEAEYELPDERLTVRWVAGSNVYEGHCGRDNGSKWRLDDRRDAISGTIAVRVTPTPEGTLTFSARLDELLLAPMDPDAPLYELKHTRLETQVDP